MSSSKFRRDRRTRLSSLRQSSFNRSRLSVDELQTLRRKASINLQQWSLQDCLLKAEIQEK